MRTSSKSSLLKRVTKERNSIMISLFSSVPKRQKRHGCRWLYQKRCFGTAETRSFHCTRMYNGKKCVIVSSCKTHRDIMKFSYHLSPPRIYLSYKARLQKWLRISRENHKFLLNAYFVTPYTFCRFGFTAYCHGVFLDVFATYITC